MMKTCIALWLAISPLVSAEQPFFETGAVAKMDASGYMLSAYPVAGRLPNGRLVCLFSASAAAKPRKMKIVAVVSDDGARTWSAPKVVFDTPNAEDDDPSLIIDGARILAFSTSVPAPYKIDRTEIWMSESGDGVRWSVPVLLKTPHRYICGKIHQGHRLSDGTLVMGYSWDTWAEQSMIPATEGEMDLKSGVLRSKDAGKTWTPGADLYAQIPKATPHSVSGLDEPALVVLADGSLMTLMRNSSARFYQSWSKDGGLTWSKPEPSQLTAHNSPAALWRLDGSGEILAAWDNSPVARRTPLAVALSLDGGKTWSPPKTIVDTGGPQSSYPSATQSKDGALIVIWQQDIPEKGREVRYARFNRAWVMEKK